MNVEIEKTNRKLLKKLMLRYLNKSLFNGWSTWKTRLNQITLMGLIDLLLLAKH